MLMTGLGATGLYAFTGAVHLALGLYIGFRMLRRTSISVEHNISFSDALATAHTASQVYEEEMHQSADESDENQDD